MKTTHKELDKRKLRNYVKEHYKKLVEKDDNPLNLEEGMIFGVKSPSR